MSIGEVVLELLKIAEPAINKILNLLGLPENCGLSQNSMNNIEKIVDKLVGVLLTVCIAFIVMLAIKT